MYNPNINIAVASIKKPDGSETGLPWSGGQISPFSGFCVPAHSGVSLVVSLTLQSLFVITILQSIISVLTWH